MRTTAATEELMTAAELKAATELETAQELETLEGLKRLDELAAPKHGGAHPAPAGPDRAAAPDAPAASDRATDPAPAATSAPAPTGLTARLARLAATGPPRPRLRVVLAATAMSTVALLALVALGGVVHHPLLIPPLAASMALVAGAPDLPLSQPRSVVGGQLLSALAGFAVLAVAGPGLWTAAVAGGLALGVMMLARTPHSPAAATAVIVALQDPPFWTFVGLLALACALLVTAGLLASRVTGRRYPTYW